MSNNALRKMQGLQGDGNASGSLLSKDDPTQKPLNTSFPPQDNSLVDPKKKKVPPNVAGNPGYNLMGRSPASTASSVSSLAVKALTGS